MKSSVYSYKWIVLDTILAGLCLVMGVALFYVFWQTDSLVLRFIQAIVALKCCHLAAKSIAKIPMRIAGIRGSHQFDHLFKGD